MLSHARTSSPHPIDRVARRFRRRSTNSGGEDPKLSPPRLPPLPLLLLPPLLPVLVLVLVPVLLPSPRARPASGTGSPEASDGAAAWGGEANRTGSRREEALERELEEERKHEAELERELEEERLKEQQLEQQLASMKLRIVDKHLVKAADEQEAQPRRGGTRRRRRRGRARAARTPATRRTLHSRRRPSATASKCPSPTY